MPDSHIHDLVIGICAKSKEDAETFVDGWINEIKLVAIGVTDQAGATGALIGREADRIIGRVMVSLDNVVRAANTAIDGLAAQVDQGGQWRVELRGISRFRGQRQTALAKLGALANQAQPGFAQEVLGAVTPRLAQASIEIDKVESNLLEAMEGVEPTLAREGLKQLAAVIKGQICAEYSRVESVQTQIHNALSNLEFIGAGLVAWPDRLKTALKKEINSAFANPGNCDAVLPAAFKDIFQNARSSVAAAISGIERAIEGIGLSFLDEAYNTLQEHLGAQLDRVTDELESALKTIAGAVDTEIGQALEQVEDRVRALSGPLESAFSRIEGVLDNVQLVPSFRDPDATLRLLRAAGEGPLLPNMKINRDRLAYVFDDYKASIRNSPAAALVDRVGQDLKALGIRVPFDGLGETLIPPSLGNFDLSKLLPDFAGLRNAGGIFPGLKMPDLSEHGIKVRHGFDKERQTAWLQADIDFALAPTVHVFSLMGLTLILRNGRMTGEAHVEATLDGVCERKWGQVRGDWALAFGNYTLVTFKDSSLRFDQSGSLRFDVDPKRIILDRSLRWLEDVIKTCGDPDSGFTLDLLQNGGLPSGMKAALKLPVPPLGTGAVTVAGLILEAFFELNLKKQEQGAETESFALAMGVGLGSPQQPFSLFIAFLGGGGYLRGEATYWPEADVGNKFKADLELGLAAGAAVAFNIGPVRGDVMVLIGLRARLEVVGKGHTVTAAVTLLIAGRASLYGIVTVGLTLYLQLIYGADRSLRGDGYLSVSVRISRFFKLKFSAPIRYTLAKGSSTSNLYKLAKNGSRLGRRDEADLHMVPAQLRRKTRC